MYFLLCFSNLQKRYESVFKKNNNNDKRKEINTAKNILPDVLNYTKFQA